MKDGSLPESGVIRNRAGVLFGTTLFGGSGMRQFRAAVLLALLTASPAMGMEQERQDIPVGDNVVVVFNLTGHIKKGDAAQLAQALPAPQPNHIYELSLNSEGGDVDEGLALANLVAAHGLWTMVEPGHQCNSSCFLYLPPGRIKPSVSGRSLPSTGPMRKARKTSFPRRRLTG